MPPSPKMNARQAKHLEFRAAPVPRFLQAFKHKVQPETKPRSELDEVLGIGSSSGRDARDDGLMPDSDNGEEDWEGAHVVVVDDKKHLSLEEARQAAQLQPAKDQSTPAEVRTKSSSTSTTPVQAGIPGAPPTRGKRRAAPIGQAEEDTRKVPRLDSRNDGMDDVRALIAARKAAPSKPQDEKLSKWTLIEQEDPKDKIKAKEHQMREVEDKIGTKEETRRKKNVSARKEKKKSGKGLSFDMDD